MGKFKHNGSTVDTSKGGGYEGEQPKPGIYPAFLVNCEEHVPAGGGEPGTKWTFELSDDAGDYAGFRGYVYTNDDGALWKQDQVLVALGLQKPGGSYEGTHEKIVKDAGPVRVKLRNEMYEEERRAKVATVLKPAEGQEKPKTKGKGKGKKGKGSDDEPPF